MAVRHEDLFPYGTGAFVWLRSFCTKQKGVVHNDELMERDVVRTATQERECALLENRPFYLPSKCTEEIDRNWYCTQAFMKSNDLRALP